MLVLISQVAHIVIRVAKVATATVDRLIVHFFCVVVGNRGQGHTMVKVVDVFARWWLLLRLLWEYLFAFFKWIVNILIVTTIVRILTLFILLISLLLIVNEIITGSPIKVLRIRKQLALGTLLDCLTQKVFFSLFYLMFLLLLLLLLQKDCGS